MRALSYVYDSADPEPHVAAVLAELDRREESTERLDVAAADDPAAARREATLTVKSAVRIGGLPDALFDAAGDPDFSTGALVTEAATGRRSLHVGEAALEALRE